MIKKIVIIGGGFAGLWAVFSAVRFVRLNNLENNVEITLINKDKYHGLRPRYYENDLSNTRISLEKFLSPLNVKLIIAEVSKIDYTAQTIILKNQKAYKYDRLILATGSHLIMPQSAGLKNHIFNIDTFHAAKKLQDHIKSLSTKNKPGRFTIIVVGGGFTGVEAAADFIDRLKKIASAGEAKVIIIDRSKVASGFSKEMQETILIAFNELGIETISNVAINKIDKDHIELSSGERIETQTVVWTAGMKSNSLTKDFNLKLDQFGRLPVDRFLRVKGMKNCFAAGDVAAATTDGKNTSLLSCQHAMPQGRVAGNNAIADLFNMELTLYEQPKYVTCIDLGSWGAIYAEGWDQHVIKVKEPAKKIKLFINHDRIYPSSVEDGIDKLLESAQPTFRPIKF